MTKNKIVSILKKSGEYVSGEEMSQTLGISRAAVNAAVKALRNDGYEISSQTNRGYLLVKSPDIINIGEIDALLPAGRAENIICLETVDSTNTYLKTLATNDVTEGLAVIANEQTGGRGRRGRSFVSPKDKGIYLSMLLKPESMPEETANITAYIAVAMCLAIEKACNVRPGIKWVNDLVLNNRKICGILTEMSIESESGLIQYVITGIGINANHKKSDFPEDIWDVATSISAESGKQVDRNALAAEMIAALDKVRRDWPDKNGDYLQEYRKRCVNLGRDVRFSLNGKEYFGRVVDVADDFGIIVRLENKKEIKLSSGEVSVRGMYGYV